jgi:hypothetical protein
MKIDSWCESAKISTNVCESIKTIYAKRFDTKCKYTSKIGIISPKGVNTIKDILTQVLDKLSFKYTLNYDSTPFYLFESFSDDSSKSNHEEFIEELKQQSDIFIKVEYLAKVI